MPPRYLDSHLECAALSGQRLISQPGCRAGLLIPNLQGAAEAPGPRRGASATLPR
jgi:hypothetical protein